MSILHEALADIRDNIIPELGFDFVAPTIQGKRLVCQLSELDGYEVIFGVEQLDSPSLKGFSHLLVETWIDGLLLSRLVKKLSLNPDKLIQDVKFCTTTCIFIATKVQD